MTPEELNTIDRLFIMICIAVFAMICYGIIAVVFNEKDGNKFRKSLKIGDEVYVSSGHENSNNCEVIGDDVYGDGEFVALKIIVRKRFCYPTEEQKRKSNI